MTNDIQKFDSWSTGFENAIATAPLQKSVPLTVQSQHDLAVRYNVEDHANVATSAFITILFAYVFVRVFRALQLRMNSGWVQAKAFYDDTNKEFMELTSKISKDLQLLVLYGRDGELTQEEIAHLKMIARKAENGNNFAFCPVVGDQDDHRHDGVTRRDADIRPKSNPVGGHLDHAHLRGFMVKGTAWIGSLVRQERTRAR